ncbi:MAG: DUF1592 domain-containing protein [Acidobacteria bacterium]|nr:DUF1592 domain-containing protein [Acidobacteriota bacterium]
MRILLLAFAVAAAAPAADEFQQSIRPVLAENCSGCHDPSNPKQKVPFLRDQTAEDVASHRRLWANVAEQLHNRTMPPGDSKLGEEARFRVAEWIRGTLRETACRLGDYAGEVTVRRLNRREYRNTIRDLLGVDLEVSEIFPVDNTGGEGFDTNGETLFLPPMLLERYMEAAQQVLDRAIVTPPLNRQFPAATMDPPAQVEKDEPRALAAKQELGFELSVYLEDEYEVRLNYERPADAGRLLLVKADGLKVAELAIGKDANGGATARSAKVRLARGVHRLSIVGDAALPLGVHSVQVTQQAPEPSAEKRAVHYRLFRMEPGQPPLQPRRAARILIEDFLPKAFRRPAEAAEAERFLALFDRAIERGDPYEESVKLALKGVLLSPDFLFRNEQAPTTPGLHPLSDYELAVRLSYFLWSTAPDERLTRLASEGKLQDEAVLAGEVERMLDDPRSRVFAETFMGQWLGTKDVGGRVAPTVNAVQHFYTPEVAKDMREEPVLLFAHMLGENRSLLDFLDADYGFLTERLVKFYEMESEVRGVEGAGFQLVRWPDARRGGILGLGAVLAMTSHFEQTSPVLRGAYVLETVLGASVPSPPPDVPPLETGESSEKGLTIRQKLQRHRADPSCSACHNMIDPMGFGLENFDWLGRWRSNENGSPVDASGVTPDGETFEGPAELRQVLLGRKDELVRHVTAKVLGYALGRSLLDEDQCVIQQITDKLAREGYPTRGLVREVVLSKPFRYAQLLEQPAPQRLAEEE